MKPKTTLETKYLDFVIPKDASPVEALICVLVATFVGIPMTLAAVTWVVLKLMEVNR